MCREVGMWKSSFVKFASSNFQARNLCKTTCGFIKAKLHVLYAIKYFQLLQAWIFTWEIRMDQRQNLVLYKCFCNKSSDTFFFLFLTTVFFYFIDVVRSDSLIIFQTPTAISSSTLWRTPMRLATAVHCVGRSAETCTWWGSMWRPCMTCPQDISVISVVRSSRVTEDWKNM